MYLKFISTFVFFVSLLFPLFAVADDLPVKVDEKRVFNLVFENDIFAGTDQGYTNGVRFAWSSSERHTPEVIAKIARNLPHLDPNGKKRISFAVGQSMFAPQDLTRTDLIVNDRPYAGWLYGSVGVVSDTGKTLDNAMLTVGVIGPWSLAENTQKFVHKKIFFCCKPPSLCRWLSVEAKAILLKG